MRFMPLYAWAISHARVSRHYREEDALRCDKPRCYILLTLHYYYFIFTHRFLAAHFIIISARFDDNFIQEAATDANEMPIFSLHADASLHGAMRDI